MQVNKTLHQLVGGLSIPTGAIDSIFPPNMIAALEGTAATRSPSSDCSEGILAGAFCGLLKIVAKNRLLAKRGPPFENTLVGTWVVGMLAAFA